MKKFRVKWKLEGTYTLTSNELDLQEDEGLSEATERVNDDPLAGVDPTEGKVTVEVTEIQ